MSDLFDGDNGAPGDGPAPERMELADRFLDGSTFTRVSLARSVVADSRLMHARIDDVNAEGLTFENVNLTGARFHDVNLTGAAIDHARLTDVALTDVDVTGMTIDGILVSDLLAKWHAGG